jgi:hypothetical protein
MKNLFKNNASFIASQMFMLVVALVLTFCMGFVGKGYSNHIKTTKAPVFEMDYSVEMDRAEELEILEEVMTSGIEEVVETPMTVKIYNINGGLLYQASGTQLELMQDTQLNQMLEKSDLMMEMGNEYVYLK